MPLAKVDSNAGYLHRNLRRREVRTNFSSSLAPISADSRVAAVLRGVMAIVTALPLLSQGWQRSHAYGHHRSSDHCSLHFFDLRSIPGRVAGRCLVRFPGRCLGRFPGRRVIPAAISGRFRRLFWSAWGNSWVLPRPPCDFSPLCWASGLNAIPSNGLMVLH